ncbi:MAG: IS5 family transposase [Gammaproteobacteria bacterium]|nr:IS5 family transposase [Gammaproteobacteria bacterium]
MLQCGFFDLDNRYQKLDERDPLTSLNRLVDWEHFRPTLTVVQEKNRKSRAGRTPYDVVLMFKVLVIQHLYNLSDDESEYQIKDRYSFCRFLGLTPEGKIPDAKTIGLFREQLVEHELMGTLFDDFDEQLNAQGYKARKGQIVDAGFVDVPKQRSSRGENEQIKAGEISQRFKDNPNVGRQKDTDARWAKNNEATHFGYKNHVAVDNAHKLVREYEVTSAEVHDSQVFIELLADNTSADVWADSAYQNENNEISLAAMERRSPVHKKGNRNNPLSQRSKKSNARRAKTRARIEPVFGSLTNEQSGLYSRVIGLARTEVKVGMMNRVYNMRRFVTLCRTDRCAI